jgi:hypothetical protein
MNDRRSRIRYSVCSSDRLWSDCSSTILNIIGLAASIALAFLALRLRHALYVSAEILPWHDLLDPFQRIALGADRLQPALNIEKALLPMTRSLFPGITAYSHRVTFVRTWREEFFEVPYHLIEIEKEPLNASTRIGPDLLEGLPKGS